jgi:plastocyanin
MRKRFALIGLAAAAVVAAGASYAVASTGSAHHAAVVVVKTPGSELFILNKEAADTRHFAPGTITVHSGDEVTFWKTDKGMDPHTVTLSTKAGLPHSFQSPCPACQIASHHLKNPNNENSGVKTYVLNAAQPGFDAVGDSIALAPQGPHSKYTVTISAPAGTTLYYVCAIHPWMQGKIIVK